jgi:hypothetical protein
MHLGSDGKSAFPRQLAKVKTDLIPTSPSDPLFKLNAFTATVLVNFFQIFNTLFGSAEGGFLTLLSPKNWRGI